MKQFMWILFFLSVLALAARRGQAQPSLPPPYERPDLWTVVQDSMIAGLVDGSGDTIAPNQISGDYTFAMVYDSTSRISYTFTEPWLNGNRLTLDKWVNGRSVNAHEDILSFNSRTKNFKVKTGDVVRFYREWDWINLQTNLKDTFTFFCRDTLSYSVELIRSYDMSRLVLLDSITVMPQMPAGSFHFYGPHNFMAAVEYQIPAWIDGDSVCMRVRVRARGSGEYFFTRQDGIKSSYSSSAMSDPVLLADLQYVQNCCWSPITLPEPQPPLEKRRPAHEMMEANLLSVQQTEPGVSQVAIRIAPAPMFGPLSVTITDAQGRTISTPFSGTVATAQEIPYRFPASGIYLVSLTGDGNVLSTTKVTVTK